MMPLGANRYDPSTDLTPTQESVFTDGVLGQHLRPLSAGPFGYES